MDPNLVGALLVVVVIGFVVLYAWIDKKNSKRSTSPKSEPSGIKCENCGAPTNRIDQNLVKCGHCGNTQILSSSVIEPQNLREQVIRKTHEKEQEEKLENIKSNNPLFGNLEYDTPEYELASKDPLGEFAQDSANIQKKLNKEFLEGVTSEQKQRKKVKK